jgi:hypothetical protein
VRLGRQVFPIDRILVAYGLLTLMAMVAVALIIFAKRIPTKPNMRVA